MATTPHAKFLADLIGDEKIQDVTDLFVPQVDFPVNDANAQVWTVSNLVLSSLQDYKDVSRYGLYLRSSTHSVARQILSKIRDFCEGFGFLNYNQMPVLDFDGPAGVGKSTLLFGLYSLYDGGNKLWITSIEKTGGYGILLRLNGRYYRSTSVDNQEDLTQYIGLLPTSIVGSVSMVVFDGDFHENAFNIFRLFEIGRLKLLAIRCTSGNRIAEGITSSAFVENIITVPSFTFEEYMAAGIALAGNPYVAKAFQRQANTLSSWFYYCGGNARVFCLNDTLELAKQQMDSYLLKVGPVEFPSLLQGYVTTSMHRAVNSVIAIVHPDNTSINKYTVVSRYVMEVMMKSVRLRSIEVTRKYLFVRENPVYEGWILEAETITRAEISITRSGNESESSYFKLYNRSGKPAIRVKLNAIQRFNTLNDLPIYGYSDSSVHTLFVPNKWYNPGYDAMLVHTNRENVTVRIIQCTVSTSHSCELKYPYDFMNMLFDAMSGSPGCTTLWRDRPVGQATVAIIPNAAAPAAAATADLLQQQTEQQLQKVIYIHPPPPNQAEPDSQPVQIRSKRWNIVNVYETTRRGTRATLLAAMRQLNPEFSTIARNLKMKVHYCIVTTIGNINDYDHWKVRPTAESLQLIQQHDPHFNFDGSFHTYYYSPE